MRILLPIGQQYNMTDAEKRAATDTLINHLSFPMSFHDIREKTCKLVETGKLSNEAADYAELKLMGVHYNLHFPQIDWKSKLGSLNK